MQTESKRVKSPRRSLKKWHGKLPCAGHQAETATLLPTRRAEPFVAFQNIMECLAAHSGLMPANLITLAHFSVSSRLSFPKWAGKTGSPGPPRSAARSRGLGRARPE